MVSVYVFNKEFNFSFFWLVNLDGGDTNNLLVSVCHALMKLNYKFALT